MSAERGADKREAILQAALALFAERGFHGTSVPSVAELAEVGAGTIYRYFESKEALVNALFLQWKSVVARMFLDEFPFHLPVREQFRSYWKRMAAFAREHPKAIQFMELHHHGPYLDDVNRGLEARVQAMACAWIDGARQQQILKDVPAAVVIAFVHGAFAGVLRASWLGQLELTDEVVDQSERCCWEAIRA